MEETYTLKQIKKELVSLGISQSKLAEDLDYNKDYINRILNEREVISKKLHLKLVIYINGRKYGK